MTTLLTKDKKRKHAVNAIERVYVEEGIYSKNFTEQLLDFISFILNRYSNDNSFPDDMIHFTYARVMERLGAVIPPPPKLTSDEKDNKLKMEKWKLDGKVCLFDFSRSNLGNYIFSISRHAHSNWVYHDSKKFKELEPPSTEIPEPETFFEINEELKSKVLYINDNAEISGQLPSCLRRYKLWKLNA